MANHKFVFFGVRGSYPVSGSRYVKFGGNTASVFIDAGDIPLIIDAGTGIINIGKYLQKNEPRKKEVVILLTHLHIDHIQGLPFFDPIFNQDYKITIYCPDYRDVSVEKTIHALFNHPYCPISIKGVKAKLKFVILQPEQPKTIHLNDNMTVQYIKENSHPICGVLLFKISCGESSLAFCTDIESPDGLEKEHLDFISGVDVLIHDSQYFDNDYNSSTNSKKGFGHSTFIMAANNALAAGVKKLYLFHYSPSYVDEKIEKMLYSARKIFKNTHLSIEQKINKF